MPIRHFPILKLNAGELKALSNLDSATTRNIMPLFEVGPVTDAIRGCKYMQASSAPVMTYLNRKIDAIGPIWAGNSALIDAYQWPAESRVENGDHIIPYLVERLRSTGVFVTPVVGYDRWESADYKLGLKSVEYFVENGYCIRLDGSAVEDSAEPGQLEHVVADMIAELGLNPRNCSILLDFADISTANMPVQRLIADSRRVIERLLPFSFGHYIIAGCSLPPTINLAVGDHDSVGSVLRKEMIVWQALRLEFLQLDIRSGDYGIRGPTTSEQFSKYINGKIRHTIAKQTFVVRGHPFRSDGGKHIQLHTLSETLTGSIHFLGEDFSWGDGRIMACARRAALGSPGDWIAIDTNHHLTFVVQEVEEFERLLVEPMRALV